MNGPRNERQPRTDDQPRRNDDGSPCSRFSRRRLLRLTSLGIAGAVGASPAAAQSLPNVLTIEGTGSRATYEFGVSGELEKSTANGANLNPRSDEISGSSASGVVGTSADSYAFSGELTAFSLDGDAEVFLNGDRFDPTPDNVLTIEGTGSRATYEFGVSGELEKSTANGANLNPRSDEISGSSASGVVGTSADSYAFSGELTAFSLDGDADVSLNGERLDPIQYLDHVLTIEGTGSRATYEFGVSGELEKSTANGANLNPRSDEISGSSASGVVGTSADSYAFSGGITDFSLDGDADVSLDGDRFDPTPDNVLTIEGTGSRATYEFGVSGLLEKSTANGGSINGNDRISGSSASGVVGTSADSYAFSGGLTDFSLDGDADVFLNGDPLDVAPPTETLTFSSDGGRFAYEFSVTGKLEKSDAMGASIDDNDVVSGRTATGQGKGGTDSYAFSGELLELGVDGDVTVYLNGEEFDPSRSSSPLLGVHNGLGDADFETIDRIESWQGSPYAVQNFFVPWNPDEGHMDWLFEHILPRIWDAGRVPIITWEPFTPDTRTASIDTRSVVKRGNYDRYLAGLAGTTTDDVEVRIANGEYDRYIKRWAGRLQEWLAGPDGVTDTGDDRRAYLRLGHEMNGDWYPWSPTVGDSMASDYVDMWRHVHRQFEYTGIDSAVQWMWCVNAEDVGSYTAEQLYPGDAYVDWFAIDGYQWGASEEWSEWRQPSAIFDEMLGRLRGLADKPVCVAETASTSETSSGYDPARKGAWIRSAFEYFDDEAVDLWCWFNEDKETDWAMFDGARGTETVTYGGETIDAYAAYREAVDAYAATTTMESGSMTTAAFTGDR